MKKLTAQIVLWSVFALFPAMAQGQWIDDYEGVLNGEEYLRFEGVGDAVVSDRGLTASGQRVYVGPYRGSFSGVTSPSFSILCVDFVHTAGSQQVAVSGIGSDAGDILPTTRLNVTGIYRSLAYYGSLFDSWDNLGYGTDRRTVWTALHSAIWTVATGSDIGGATYALRDRILADHSASAAAYSADGWYVLSGTNGYDRQEMLIRTPASTVPEPSTYLLMATGLLFLAVFGRKRLKNIESA